MAIMRRTMIVGAVLLSGMLMSVGAAAQPLVGGDLDRFMPEAEAFPDAYAIGMELPRTNEQFGADWGDEIYQVCVETGRSDGYMRIYELQSPDAILAPERFVLLIERFDSPEGAAAWWDYDFPGPFRGYKDQAQPLELADVPSRDLSAADAARLVEIETTGEAPFALEKYLEYRFRNVQVLVWAQGNAEFDVKYMRWLGAKVLQAMAGS